MDSQLVFILKPTGCETIHKYNNKCKGSIHGYHHQNASVRHGNDDETQTLGDLTANMTECLDGDSCKTSSQRYMENKLREHLDDYVTITTINAHTVRWSGIM